MFHSFNAVAGVYMDGGVRFVMKLSKNWLTLDEMITDIIHVLVAIFKVIWSYRLVYGEDGLLNKYLYGREGVIDLKKVKLYRN